MRDLNKENQIKVVKKNFMDQIFFKNKENQIKVVSEFFMDQFFFKCLT